MTAQVIDFVPRLRIIAPLTKEDVWGVYDLDKNERTSDGMIVARSGDKCPIFGRKVPYKSVTVVCSEEQADEVAHWLGFVHGSECIRREKTLKDGSIAMRSSYTAW